MNCDHRLILRRKLDQQGIVQAPGAYGGLSALLVEQGNFDEAFLSGACLSFARFGRPDMGLVTAILGADELLANGQRFAASVEP